MCTSLSQEKTPHLSLPFACPPIQLPLPRFFCTVLDTDPACLRLIGWAAVEQRGPKKRKEQQVRHTPPPIAPNQKDVGSQKQNKDRDYSRASITKGHAGTVKTITSGGSFVAQGGNYGGDGWMEEEVRGCGQRRPFMRASECILAEPCLPRENSVLSPAMEYTMGE